MRVSTVSDVKEMDKKELIRCFKGTVKAQFKRSAGTDDQGRDWSFENLAVKDKDGHEITVVLANREPVGNVKGKLISFCAHEGSKGWSGVYAIDNEYNGKTTRQIRVTGSAEIALGSSESDSNGDEAQSDGEEDYRPQKRSQAATSPSDIGKAKVFLAKRRNAWILSYDAAISAGDEMFKRHPSVNVTEDMILAMTQSFYNSGCYKDGLWEALPAAPLPRPKAKQPTVEDEAGEGQFPDEEPA